MLLTLYGLKHCASCRKASNWLKAQHFAYQFHDWRMDGVDPAVLDGWADPLGWERLLNRQNATWRNLLEEARQDIDRDRALALMLAYPALIKRPILDADGKLLLGFTAGHYGELT